MLARRLAVLTALALLGPRAAAAGQDDRSLSASLSGATYDGQETTGYGGMASLEYERGISDSVALRAMTGLGLYCDVCTVGSLHAAVGLTYLFDVLKYVPYATAGVGALLLAGGDMDFTIQPVAELGVGLDILRSREFAWGPVVRSVYRPGELVVVTAGLRASWRWGFF